MRNLPVISFGVVVVVSTLAVPRLHAQDATTSFPIANGDVNADGKVDISDSIYLINWAFSGGPEPVPLDCPLSPVGPNPVLTLFDRVEVGSSMLHRAEDMVSITIDTTDIPAGYAVSVWWVVFNNPELCSDGACGRDDRDNPAVESDLIAGSGGIVTRDGDRQVITSHILLGDTSGSYNEPFGFGENFGLTNPMGAEFHVVLRSHGPAIPGQIWDQVSTFEGGCEVNLNWRDGVVPDETGECGDIQVTVHKP